MNPEPPTPGRWMTGGIALLALGFFIAIGFWPATRPPPGEPPTAGFLRHHNELKGVLQDWTEMLDALPAAGPRRQGEIMEFSLGFLRQHLLSHEASEERVLYPAVDRLVGTGPRPFTTPLRLEHRIIERWVHLLDERAASSPPDAAGFVRQAYELVGLLRAHFEVEETLLLPILDRKMSRDQFRREVWQKMLSDLE